MKIKFVKKVLATTMAVSMMATPFTVFATNSASAPASSGATEAAAEEEGEAPAEAVEIAAGGKVTAGGVTLSPTASGVSTVRSVDAVVVTEESSTLAADLGLAPGERAFTTSYDITPKNSPAAAACIELMREAVGGDVLGMFNLNIGKISGGQYIAANGEARIRTTVVIPGGKIDPTKKYAMIVVSPGGAVRVEEDQDTNPRTVTFNANGGLCACALIAY